jgi:hypothetical protein
VARALPSELRLTLDLDDADDDAALRERAARALGTDVAALPELTVVKR